MKYFGTHLTEHGHYWWDVAEDNLFDPKVYGVELPFDPYKLCDIESDVKRFKGTMVFKNFKGLSVLAIEGSCTDYRWGTFSVFVVEEELSKEEMLCKMSCFPIIQKIINQMPFEVEINWKLKLV